MAPCSSGAEVKATARVEKQKRSQGGPCSSSSALSRAGGGSDGSQGGPAGRDGRLASRRPGDQEAAGREADAVRRLLPGVPDGFVALVEPGGDEEGDSHETGETGDHGLVC